MKRILKENVNTKEHWDMVYGQDLYTKGVDDIKYQYIAQHIINGSRVLDLGCGNGDALKVIADKKPECKLVGIDFSEVGIQKATKLLINTGATLFADDILSGAPFLSGFDYVLSLETLEHLEDTQGLVNRMCNVLNEGGKAFLTTPFEDHIPSGEHVWEFDYDDVRLLFRSAGFKKVWVFPYASGRAVLHDDGTLKYPKGNLDEIFVLAIK